MPITWANINLKRRNRYQYKGDDCKFYGSYKVFSGNGYFLLQCTLQLLERKLEFCTSRRSCPLDWQSPVQCTKVVSSWIEEGWARNTFSLINHRRKRSNGEKSSDRGGLGKLDRWEISFPGKRFRSHSIAAWEGAMSPHPAGTTLTASSLREKLLAA